MEHGNRVSPTPTNPMSWTGYVITLQGTTKVYSSDTAYVNGPGPNGYQGLYGVDIYSDTQKVGYYQIADITTDPNTWLFYYRNNTAENSTYATVEDQGYYSEPYMNNTGPVNMYIYHWNSSGHNIPDCPIYLLFDPFKNSSTTFFDGQSHLWTAPAKDPAMAMKPNWFHLIWQYHNATTNKDQIVYKKIKPSVEANIESTPYQMYIGNGTNPAITSYVSRISNISNHTAVVYIAGGVIVVVTTRDDAEELKWTPPVVIGPGAFPDIVARGDKLYCAYVNNGNLYVTMSADDGGNWTTPEQINDVNGTVSAEENEIDIHSAGVVWVDTRGADKEIYYAPLPGLANDPPNPPTIDGPTSGNAGAHCQYGFTALDPNDDNVSYFIDWGDHTTSGWLGPNPSGQEIVVNHTWTQKGAYTIAAKAQDIYDDESNWSTFNVSMHGPRTFLIGLIHNLTFSGDYITFNPTLVLAVWLSPFSFTTYASGQIMISKNHTGVLGKRFIVGMFSVTVLTKFSLSKFDHNRHSSFPLVFPREIIDL